MQYFKVDIPLGDELGIELCSRIKFLGKKWTVYVVAGVYTNRMVLVLISNISLQNNYVCCLLNFF